jgi:type IV secretory pathway VirB2 component (pilin)
MEQSTFKTLAARLTRAAILLPERTTDACFRRARQFDGRRVAAFALAAVVMTAAADPAFAQSAGGQGDITTFLQNLVNIITGTAGKLIAVLAICVVGVGAALGALSMRAAGGTILGILLIFSSAWIVNQIIGGGS